MIKRLNMLAICAALAACAGDRGAAPPEPSVVVGFADQTTASRLGAPVIDVKAANPQPLATAELVGPAGTVVAAAPGQLEPQVPAGSVFGPSVGFGIFGGSSSGGGAGVGIGVPIGGGYGGYGATVPPGDLVRSRAYILVPDMAAYRRDWEQSTVRLKFGSATGDSTTADIPAPAPGAR
jgi:hypothetical protein